MYGCLQSTKDVFVDFKTLLFVPCLYSCKVYYSRQVCSLYGNQSLRDNVNSLDPGGARCL